MPSLTITLVTNPRGCPKCVQCEQMVARLQERWPGRIDFRTVSSDSDEAAAFGLVMPPTLIVEDLVVAAGRASAESGLTALVASHLEPEEEQ